MPKPTDKAIIEWLYAREMLRRLGFSPDDLYFAVQTNGSYKDADGTQHQFNKPVLFVKLEAQGKEFAWCIGPTQLSNEELEKAYIEACTFWNESADELMGGFESSRPFAACVPLMQALMEKGFRLPRSGATKADVVDFAKMMASLQPLPN